jgi:rare lipoprotein A
VRPACGLVAALTVALSACASVRDSGSQEGGTAEQRGAATAPQILGQGLASWYGLAHHGRRTASGEKFDMNALTAAHPTLPFGTRVLVRNPANGRSVTVRINDRGPYTGGRIIDLSFAAARVIGIVGFGTGTVVLTAAPAAPVPVQR